MSAAQSLMPGVEAAAEKGRAAHDFYPTPEPLALKCCEALKESGLALYRPSLILEPSCGSGPFVRSARTMWPRAEARAFDIRPDAAEFFGPEFECRNSLSDWGCRPDVVLGNPPFDAAEAHIRCALEQVARGGVVAFLLRLGFMASEERIPFFREHPLAALAPIPQRPSFTSDGKTDGADYGLFVWSPTRNMPILLPPILWRGSEQPAQASLFGGAR